MALFRKKVYTAEVKIEMLKKYMSTCLFVGLFAVSGVLAVDGDPAVAAMHAVTDVHAVVGHTVAGVPASCCCSLTSLLLLVFPSPMPEKSLEPWSETIYCTFKFNHAGKWSLGLDFQAPTALPLAREMDPHGRMDP